MTHLILGGAGHSGARIIDRLTALGEPVRPASRRNGFDWHDRSTWADTLRGATSAYVSYSPDIAFPGASDILRRVGEAARTAGIQRLVLLSGRGEEGARASEDALRAAGLPTAVLRCSWFAQNFSEHFLLGPVLRGRLRLPAPDVPEAFVDLDDVAEVAVRALLAAEPLDATLELSGPGLLTFADVAAELSRATGRDIVFERVSNAEFVSDAALDGVPAEEAAPLAELFAEVLDGRNASITDGVQNALGRPATSFRRYAERAAATGVWS